MINQYNGYHWKEAGLNVRKQSECAKIYLKKEEKTADVVLNHFSKKLSKKCLCITG